MTVTTVVMPPRTQNLPVTVIDRDTLDARGVRTTQEALAGIPGLTAASPPGNGNAVTYRGFSGSQITQLFNGIDVQYASIAANVSKAARDIP